MLLKYFHLSVTDLTSHVLSSECGDNYMSNPLPYQEEIEYTRQSPPLQFRAEVRDSSVADVMKTQLSELEAPTRGISCLELCLYGISEGAGILWTDSLTWC